MFESDIKLYGKIAQISEWKPQLVLAENYMYLPTYIDKVNYILKNKKTHWRAYTYNYIIRVRRGFGGLWILILQYVFLQNIQNDSFNTNRSIYIISASRDDWNAFVFLG